MIAAGLFAIGLTALLVGADLVVRSATGLALRVGVSPLVIGLTVVSIGTSLPELAIGVDAARTGSPGLAVGNIVGTNLVNLLLILGLSALMMPIVLDRVVLRRDVPAMVGSAGLLAVLALDGELGLVDGLLLVACALGYTGWVLRTSRTSPADAAVPEPGSRPAAESTPAPSGRPLLSVLALVAGMVAILLGADWLVDGATRAARGLGVSEAVIGLTIVAIGTSAPELVTTIVSTVRGSREVALGNLLGSSTYNIVLVLGITVLAAPAAVPVVREVVGSDLVLLVAVTVLSVPTFLTGGRISRLEGGVAVAAYLGYLAWLLTTRT